MKPPPFRYERPEHLEEVLGLLAEHGDEATLLAGGQSLVPLLCLRLARPEVVIDLGAVTGLDAIDVNESAIRIGAMVTARQLERSSDVAAAAPIFREALGHLAHPQIRTRTTIGGNIAHADPAAELPAVLAALDGTVRLRSAAGDRSLPASEFFVGPLMSARGPDEALVQIDAPRLAGYSTAFEEIARRHGDYGLAAAAVAVQVVDEVVQDARIALAGVGATPVRATRAEAALRGTTLDTTSIADVKAIVTEEVDLPGDDATIAHRAALAGVVTSRALTRIGERR